MGQLALAFCAQMSVKHARLAAREALHTHGVEGWISCTLDDLDDWELRKLSLLRAVAVKPDLLLFDCDLSSYTAADELWAMLYEARGQGAGILLTCREALKNPVDGEYELSQGVLHGPLRIIQS